MCIYHAKSDVIVNWSVFLFQRKGVGKLFFDGYRVIHVNKFNRTYVSSTKIIKSVSGMQVESRCFHPYLSGV